jgi:hypothetical protein
MSLPTGGLFLSVFMVWMFFRRRFYIERQEKENEFKDFFIISLLYFHMKTTGDYGTLPKPV